MALGGTQAEPFHLEATPGLLGASLNPAPVEAAVLAPSVAMAMAERSGPMASGVVGASMVEAFMVGVAHTPVAGSTVEEAPTEGAVSTVGAAFTGAATGEPEGGQGKEW